MSASVHALANRALLLSRGAFGVLSELDTRQFSEVSPAQIFPRIGRVELGGAPAVQHHHTTCGTTVLAMANALFDPDLLERLQHRNSGVALAQRRNLAAADFAALQHHLLGKVTGRTWPRALGTPPWGLARHLRVPGVRYEHMPIDDRNSALAEVMTGLLRRALAAGIPVPVYVGGSLREKASSALPRHVVLLVPPAAIPGRPRNDHVRIYEPAAGRIYRRRWDQLWARTRPNSAFGGWTSIAWILVPAGTAYR